MNRVMRSLWIASGVSGGLVLVGFMSAPAETAQAWMTAFAFAFTVIVGMLMLLMIGHVTEARWIVVLRRLGEGVVSAAPLLVLLFVPVLISLEAFYPWARSPRELAPDVREVLHHRQSWSSAGAFVGRSATYLGAVVLFAELLTEWSRRQDERQVAETLRRRMARGSVMGLIVLSLVVTFAAFDWWMSLDAIWVSSIYGVHVFAGSMVAALSTLSVSSVVARSRNVLPSRVGPSHFHALGRLLLAFVIFWAYITFCQALLMWIADLPHEVVWYGERWHGGWQWVAIVLVVGHFALPFLLLLSRRLKLARWPLLPIGCWLLAMHYLDLFWLIVPSLRPGGFNPHWVDLAAWLFVVSTSAAFASLRFRGRSVVPIGDPVLEESLRYEST